MRDGKFVRGKARKDINIISIALPPPTILWPNPLPVKHPITIQDGSIENLIYLALRSEIMPKLKASWIEEMGILSCSTCIVFLGKTVIHLPLLLIRFESMIITKLLLCG